MKEKSSNQREEKSSNQEGIITTCDVKVSHEWEVSLVSERGRSNYMKKRKRHNKYKRGRSH